MTNDDIARAILDGEADSLGVYVVNRGSWTPWS